MRKKMRYLWKKFEYIVKKHIRFVCLMLLFGSLAVYFFFRAKCGANSFDDMAMAVLAIVAAVLFWLEYYKNCATNEAQLIMELNNQFISNPQLSKVEWDLENYYAQYKTGKLNESHNQMLRDKYALETEDRQDLINYLVHLEGIAALVNNEVLHLSVIDDLMAYRYFIAINNPVVQELELLPYGAFYQGCYKLYSDWQWTFGESNVPLKDFNLLRSAEKMEKKRAMLKQEIADCIREKYREDDYLKNPAAYIYDLTVVRKNVEQVEKNMPKQVKLYYAMKANSEKEILETIAHCDYVQGLEIASAGEMACAEQYYTSKHIIFTGPGKTEYELEEAIKKGIRFINVESVVEAKRINDIAGKLGRGPVEVLIRINLDNPIINSAENMTGYSTKMGIDEKKYINSFEEISSFENIVIKGVHVFAASGVLDYEVLIEKDRYIFEFVKKAQEKVGEIEIIDLGGGFGIDYTYKNQQFDIKRYGKELSKLISKFGFRNKEIIIELGTYLVGNAGYYTSKIIDIKEVKGKKHIIIAGGVNHMGLPLEMRRKHPVCIVPMQEPKVYENQESVSWEIADISGPLCIVSDKLCWDEYLESAEIGDIVVFSQAGAYCYGEGMIDFLMHERPIKLIVESDI